VFILNELVLITEVKRPKCLGACECHDEKCKENREELKQFRQNFAQIVMKTVKSAPKSMDKLELNFQYAAQPGRCNTRQTRLEKPPCYTVANVEYVEQWNGIKTVEKTFLKHISQTLTYVKNVNFGILTCFDKSYVSVRWSDNYFVSDEIDLKLFPQLYLTILFTYLKKRSRTTSKTKLLIPLHVSDNDNLSNQDSDNQHVDGGYINDVTNSFVPLFSCASLNEKINRLETAPKWFDLFHTIDLYSIEQYHSQTGDIVILDLSTCKNERLLDLIKSSSSNKKQQLVIKIADKKMKNEYYQLLNELTIYNYFITIKSNLIELNMVLKPIFIGVYSQLLYLVLPYGGQTINDFIFNKTLSVINYTKDELLMIMQQLYRQTKTLLKTVHQNGINHNDLRPQNILVNETNDKKLIVTLIDFAHSSVMNYSFDQEEINWQENQLLNEIFLKLQKKIFV
ncbi:unnamed protein product, partial [Didymodactylos carnosus]